MILRSGYKVEYFISSIACTIARSEHARVCAEDVHDALAKDGIIYLAGGYWRAQPVTDGDCFKGVCLINPDRTPEEIAAVERGIAILCGLGYE